jgi:hypothetical protein
LDDLGRDQDGKKIGLLIKYMAQGLLLCAIFFWKGQQARLADSLGGQPGNNLATLPFPNINGKIPGMSSKKPPIL